MKKIYLKNKPFNFHIIYNVIVQSQLSIKLTATREIKQQDHLIIKDLWFYQK